ncbi:MFS transporter [Actinomycetota bacterium]|nr:MFS transporter [Actinomycetota bacterium]
MSNPQPAKQKKLITPFRLILIAIAMLTIQFMTSSSKTMIAPIMTDLVAYFQADLGWTSLILTVPALAMIPGTIVCGALANKYSQKMIALVGVILFFIGGVAPVFFDNIVVVIVFRAVLGFGAGLTRVFATSWIPLFFKGKAADTMMGITNAVGGLMGTLSSIIGGFLGTISWQAVMWGNAIVLIVGITIILFVPEPNKFVFSTGKASDNIDAPVVEKAADSGDLAPKGSNKVPGIAWLYALVIGLEFLCVTLIYSVCGPRIVELGFTTVDAGFAVGLIGIAMAVVSFLYGTFASILKRWAIVVAIALALIAYLILGFTSDLILIEVACVLIGMTMAFSNNTIFNYVNIDCKGGNVPMAVAIVTSGLNVGGFLSSFLIQGVGQLAGPTNYTGMFMVTAGILVVLTIISVVVVITANRISKQKGLKDTN